MKKRGKDKKLKEMNVKNALEGLGNQRKKCIRGFRGEHW
jgi:hypothetical protein